MTMDSSVLMETVSLDDDDHKAPAHMPVLDIETVEDADHHGLGVDAPKIVRSVAFPTPVHDEDDDDDVIVVVDSNSKPVEKPPRMVPPALPPLRVVKIMRNVDDDHDYMDSSLFSPELSRHSMEQAVRRAKHLEQELVEEAALEDESPRANMRLTPLEAVAVISSAFVASMSRVKHLVKSSDREYDLLGGSSPSSKTDDLDADGDGLQLSPDGTNSGNKHFASPTVRPALKRISAYAGIEKKQLHPRKGIQWHEEVLDQDEEFVDDDGNDGDDGDESEAFMVNGKSGALAERQPTPRPPRKKRKKLMRSVIRRLSAREKEELYRQRPDLMIIPNWAQKYREEMSNHDSARWTFGLVASLGTLAILLIILVILIAKDKAAAASQ